MANNNPNSEVSNEETLKPRSYKTSGDIDVPDRIIDQIIGQKEAVETVKKAAKQRRNVLLIGEPGVGKSMLAKGMAELLPPEELQDILVYPNIEDNHNPLIGVMPAGEGRNVVTNYKVKAKGQDERKNMFMIAIISLIVVIGFVLQQYLAAIIAAGIVFLALQQMKPRSTVMVPKLLINNNKRNMAPFVDATGAHAGALLGDVRHDPYQSGGLGTPAHERVEAGMIHKANKGVLYVDEIGSMQMKTQQELLTAMQEKKYAITGQSETSSGAMVRSQEVPCDFVLVASGNLHVLEGMHPALRSRIRGYGYEVFMKDSMKDTPENRDKLVQFVAQEVKKDGRIPHFSKEAVAEIIHEAQRRAGKKEALTLRLRDLGGLVRAAGDIAKGEKADYVTVDHVLNAKKLARTLEQQIADRYIVQRKRYRVFKSEGGEVGKVNGLAIIGDRSGIIMPIAAEAAPAQSKDEGKIIATGKLGEIAKEAVQNVSALVKKHTGTDISNYDIHIQFLQSYEGVEGDSASVSVATAVVSALENIPVDQSVALTGSLSIRGDVLPVGGVTGKIEAAAEAGIRKVLIPKSNMEDVLIEEHYREKIEIIPVETLSEVLEHALMGKGKKGLMDKMQKITDMVPKGILQKPATN
ncbi:MULTISPECIES: ATP-dependent protease LonB [Methanobacterium]|jgi:Lon-like ATP-dependent protease|uniref:Archaeal Lon protease n=1 Tax=Methanobacterium formicicum TaxID=2162 RepID=A0A090I5I4_METFO|nr:MULTISPECIES: ATP-dependent protease LonB [Methanobacterium]AIS32581.1 ATP-dependent protease S16 family [Methanobacterium formicicum]KUK74355.1 MAG: ATP-dependent protease Lon [Methanobacterium sp. 42_16]MBF4474039.1 ATP-dependent protease LonB [Methanobacterium formicicum]MDD4810907.1 ATP-dependent protease LonB [Methanobacterium formicicum]MDG3546439.1 ATP-dependent protease LonB [Methanobacterium formicicum]